MSATVSRETKVVVGTRRLKEAMLPRDGVRIITVANQKGGV
ncbi:MAG: ParA family protein, partial [Actinobacteria bacterium]|nr:ParA family protein [Actinomycetota bacterium]